MSGELLLARGGPEVRLVDAQGLVTEVRFRHDGGRRVTTTGLSRFIHNHRMLAEDRVPYWDELNADPWIVDAAGAAHRADSRSDEDGWYFDLAFELWVEGL